MTLHQNLSARDFMVGWCKSRNRLTIGCCSCRADQEREMKMKDMKRQVAGEVNRLEARKERDPD